MSMFTTRCFNPHPALLPGDANAFRSHPHAPDVSLRTRHCCRVMRHASCSSAGQLRVSIRTRQQCRVRIETLNCPADEHDAWRITRQQCRVRSETSGACGWERKALASPGSNAGCGLKHRVVNILMEEEKHHPAAMPGAD